MSFFFRQRELPQLAHAPEQALWVAGIALLPQPQLHHAKTWIATAHITNQLQFRFRVLVKVAVGPTRLTGQRCHASIPLRLPEVDV